MSGSASLAHGLTGSWGLEEGGALLECLQRSSRGRTLCSCHLGCAGDEAGEFLGDELDCVVVAYGGSQMIARWT